MSLANIISLLGGVALFLFGMSLMGDGLKKVAGSKMEMVLYRLSGTPLRGLRSIAHCSLPHGATMFFIAEDRT